MGARLMTTPASTDTTPAAPAEPAAEQATIAPPVPTAPAQAKPETDWKAEARKHEARAKENAAAAARLAAIEEASKTEAEKLAARVTAAEAERDTARTDLLRSRTALTKGLPADLADRLRGSTEEEMAEDADRLLALIGKPKAAADVDQGVKGVNKGKADGLAQLTRDDMKRMSPEEIDAAREKGQFERLLSGT